MTTTQTTANTPTYGWASQVATLESVLKLRIAKAEQSYIARTDSAGAMARWHLDVAIVDAVTRELAEARTAMGDEEAADDLTAEYVRPRVGTCLFHDLGGGVREGCCHRWTEENEAAECPSCGAAVAEGIEHQEVSA